MYERGCKNFFRLIMNISSLFEIFDFVDRAMVNVAVVTLIEMENTEQRCHNLKPEYEGGGSFRSANMSTSLHVTKTRFMLYKDGMKIYKANTSCGKEALRNSSVSAVHISNRLHC